MAESQRFLSLWSPVTRTVSSTVSLACLVQTRTAQNNIQAITESLSSKVF